MAKFIETTLIVKISKLLKDNEDVQDVGLSEDGVSQLEAVLEELINDPKALIEVIRTDI